MRGVARATEQAGVGCACAPRYLDRPCRVLPHVLPCDAVTPRTTIEVGDSRYAIEGQPYNGETPDEAAQRMIALFIKQRERPPTYATVYEVIVRQVPVPA